METAQRFSLGALVSGKQIAAPREVAVTIQGRGIFCRIALEYSFTDDDPSSVRVFAMDRPWNAVLTDALVNGEPLDSVSSLETPLPLPQSLKVGVEEVLQEGSAEGICCYIEPGKSLRSISLTFVMVCDVLWHQSLVDFFSACDSVSMQMEVVWDLAGLPGAALSCEGEAADSRFSHLDTARYQWSETIKVGRGGRLGIKLALDEKKAASLCLFSTKDGKSGCGAVVVVAPVRPQLQRKPVKVAVFLEIRNPQEGLLTRELIDRLCATLNADDQMTLYSIGSGEVHCVMPWQEAAQVNEEVLSRLLNPSLMGRPQNYWESFSRLLSECGDATHVILSTPGPKELPPAEVSTNLPVFSFVTARKPNASTLAELSAGTGSFVGESSVDGVDSFLQRMNVRLSPPLLREFRLDGWGLESAVPVKPTQVFMDKPTLVLGLYEGLLPQTVTLAGVAPAGQKLGQRVKVENFSEFSLEPLHLQAARQGYGLEHCLQQAWRGEGVHLLEINRPAPTAELFSVDDLSDNDSLLGFGGPPAIETVSTTMTIEDEELLGASPGDADDFFSGAAGDAISDDIFSSGPSLTSTPLDSAGNHSAALKETQIFELPEERERSLEFEPEEGPLPQIELQFDEPDDEPIFDSGDLLEESGEIGLNLEFPDDSPPETSWEQVSEEQGSRIEDSLELQAAPETREDSVEPVPARKSSSEEKQLRPTAEKATLSVKLGMPDWVKALVSLEGDAIEAWLEGCPIDTLSLGLAHTEEALARTLMEKLPVPKRTAVELQVELGRLLPAEEIESACSELERLLSTR